MEGGGGEVIFTRHICTFTCVNIDLQSFTAYSVAMTIVALNQGKWSVLTSDAHLQDVCGLIDEHDIKTVVGGTPKVC